MNVTLGSDKAIHAAYIAIDGEAQNFPICGGNKAGERYSATTREVTCKKCLKAAQAEAEREQAYRDRVAASLAPATESHDLGYVHPVMDAPAPKPLAQAEDNTNQDAIERIREAVRPVDPARLDTASLKALRDGLAARLAEAEKALTERLKAFWVAAGEERAHVTVGGVEYAVERTWGNRFRFWTAPIPTDNQDYGMASPRDDLGTTLRAIWQAASEAVAELPVPEYEVHELTGYPIATIDGERFVIGDVQRERFGNVDWVAWWPIGWSAFNVSNARRAYADADRNSLSGKVWQFRYDFNVAAMASQRRNG